MFETSSPFQERITAGSQIVETWHTSEEGGYLAIKSSRFLCIILWICKHGPLVTAIRSGMTSTAQRYYRQKRNMSYFWKVLSLIEKCVKYCAISHCFPVQFEADRIRMIHCREQFFIHCEISIKNVPSSLLQNWNWKSGNPSSELKSLNPWYNPWDMSNHFYNCIWAGMNTQ